MSRLIRFILAFCIAINANASTKELEDSTLWKLSRGKEVVYILGVIHLGFKNQYPLDKNILSTFQSSSALIVESAVLYETPSEIEKRLLSQYKPKKLDDKLKTLIESESCSNKLSQDNFIKNMDLQLGADISAGLLRSSPRALFHQLYNHEIAVTPEEMYELEITTSIEHTLVNKAIKLEKPILSLDPESWESFDILSDEDKCNFYVEMFDMYRDPKYQAQINAKSIRDLKNFWEKGLSRQAEQSFFEWSDQNYPVYGKVHHKWFNIRNNLMAKLISAESQSRNTSLFVLLGLAHLAGENGVLELLKKSGFEMKSIPLNNH
jgi:uncharacterized protein YbaP (TraB family)